MTPVAHLLAAACYLGAAGTGFFARSGRRDRAVAWLLGLGVVLQVVGFFGFHRTDPPVRLDSFGAALSLIAWLTVAAFLLSLGLARLRAVGVWVGALASALIAAGAVALRVPPVEGGAGLSAGGWPHAHVLLSTAGFAALGLASIVGLAYLAKERALKTKRPQSALPSLEGLDRVEHVALAVGFPLLTLGLITGYLWSREHDAGLVTGHALFTTIAWLLYLLPVTARVVRQQRGQVPARGVVLGFAVLALSYLGVRLFGVAT